MGKDSLTFVASTHVRGTFAAPILASPTIPVPSNGSNARIGFPRFCDGSQVTSPRLARGLELALTVCYLVYHDLLANTLTFYPILRITLTQGTRM